ncbi:type VII secretion-associated serine protease mycosin [Streptomyces xanthochromogenes]|uniref:Type VII secretion-associated serine protease n=1 Tax=Streptomyces xanthochromogenes TaxID=67384 RepID=A0ABQ3AKL5_9ACTN|nr:type VII secretion-associated serine protease mycosin [Streptomyces xanthochromogenes]GGY56784.1 type VII secretion-associated serine protease [Streptomyces xanthochromogenes]
MLLLSAAATSARADTTREQQWFLDAMKAQQMWRSSTGEGVTVAVIDTGVDPSNPDLKGRVLPGRNFAQGESGDEHTDSQGHGTGMAGLIAGTGDYGGGNGAFGLAPGAKILPVRMPAEVTSGAEGTKRFNEIAPGAIRYAADEGARIINVSMGVPEGTPELTVAVKYALDKGSLVFAAVGNSGDSGNRVEYPAATPGVVGVGAVGKDLRRAAWSEYGPQVDLAAPGVEMVHPCGGGSGLCKTDGTSDATALASASAALIWSKHPTWTNNQVLRVMLNTLGGPTDGAKRNDSIGYGIVRPRVALENPGDPGPADVYPLPDLAASAAPPTPAPAGTPVGHAAPQTAGGGESEASTYGLAAGIGAVALVGAFLGYWLLRSRRRKATAAQDQVGTQGPGLGWPGQGDGGGTRGF